MMKTVSEEKRIFMLDEIIRLSISGAFQTRGERVYKSTASDADKKALHQDIAETFTDIYRSYTIGGISSCKLLELINKRLSLENQGLVGNKLRIGITQKLVNLFLKYLWCTDYAATPPPHCPFDGRVIEELRIFSPEDRELADIAKRGWTKIDIIDDYIYLVKAAKKRFPRGIAEGELEFFNTDRKIRAI